MQVSSVSSVANTERKAGGVKEGEKVLIINFNKAHCEKFKNQ